MDQLLQKRQLRNRRTRSSDAAASPGFSQQLLRGLQLHYSSLPSFTALSHVAGVQAGGALFPLEISDKNPFPPPFPPPRQDMGVGPQSRRSCREPQAGPQLLDQVFPWNWGPSSSWVLLGSPAPSRERGCSWLEQFQCAAHERTLNSSSCEF